MDYLKFEQFVSKARLDRFLIGCGNNQEKALELYKANIIISKSFYPLLHLFEVFLRNRINTILISHFGDADWIRTQKMGFMNDVSLKPSVYYLKNQISNTETYLAKKGITITSGKIISEQSLGFWTSLFENHHYKLLSGSVIHCFPLKPSTINRSSISIRLNRIRDFRNRVYHNEPICFKGATVDYTEAEIILNDIDDLLSWIDSELAAYMQYFNDISLRIAKAKRI